MKIVATMSLPAVDRPNADRWNAARSRQFSQKLSASNACMLATFSMSESLLYIVSIGPTSQKKYLDLQVKRMSISFFFILYPIIWASNLLTLSPMEGASQAPPSENI